MQVVDFFNGNLKRRRQKRKEAKAMMKLKRLSTIHSEANGAVIGLFYRFEHIFKNVELLPKLYQSHFNLIYKINISIKLFMSPLSEYQWMHQLLRKIILKLLMK